MDAGRLRQFDLFGALDDEALAEMAGRLGERRLEAGTRLFSEGDPGESMYLVAEGAVRIGKKVHGEGEEALAVLRPGSWFGELSIIDDQPRSADATAEAESLLWSLSREDFRDLVDSDPAVAVALLSGLVRTLAVRLRETNEQVKAMHLMSMW